MAGPRAAKPPDVAAAVPGAGDIVGPAGFLERLGWYREMIADLLAEGVPSRGAAAAPLRARQGFRRPLGQGSAPGAVHRDCARARRPRRGRAAGGRRSGNAAQRISRARRHRGWQRVSARDAHDASPRRSAVALNAGDAMNALALRLFRKSGERLGPATTLRILDEVDHMIVRRWRGKRWSWAGCATTISTVGTDDYLRLVLKKTAWYSFIHPLRIGALVADADDRNLEPIRSVRLSDWGWPFRLPTTFSTSRVTWNATARRSTAISGKANGRSCSLMRLVERIKTIGRGPPTFSGGRESVACRARSCGSIK